MAPRLTALTVSLCSGFQSVSPVLNDGVGSGAKLGLLGLQVTFNDGIQRSGGFGYSIVFFRGGILSSGHLAKDNLCPERASSRFTLAKLPRLILRCFAPILY